MSEPLEGRRYGRTTLMLQEARRLAQEGRAVYVVAVSTKDASRLRRMFGGDADALGVKFESSEELPIRDGRRLRGAHPNCVVLVDHYVVESENATLRARIAALEEKLSAMHRRAQKAEAALPEWDEIVALHKEQRTGRFGPALAASAVLMAGEKIAALEADREAFAREVVFRLPYGIFADGVDNDELDACYQIAIAAVKAARGET